MSVHKILHAALLSLAVSTVAGASTQVRPDSRLHEMGDEQIVSSTGAVPSVNPYGPGDAYPLYGACYSIAVADLDGDGRPELAAAEPDNNTVSIWHNDGTGHFVLAERVSFPGPPRWVVTGDFDRDGHADLAIALNADSGRVCVLGGNGDGTFSAPVPYGVGSRPKHLAVGDLDADGWPDLVTVDEGAGTVSVLMNRTGAAFTAAATLSVDKHPSAVAISDLNRDGRPDLAVANWSGTASVLQNLGEGAFAPRVDYQINGCSLDILSADLDGDGAEDLVLSQEAYGCKVLWNDGAGAFDRLDYLAVTDSDPMYSVTACDLGDGGLPDLAVAVTRGVDRLGKLALFKNRGARSFAPALDYWFGGNGYFGNSGGPGFVGFADLDGDGTSDMFVADNPLSQLLVLHRLRGATFTGIQGYSFDSASDLSSPAAVDLHGTGKTDLMLVRNGRWVVMPSLVDGTLGPPEDLGPMDAFRALDLNGDGRTDMVSMQDSTLAVRLCSAGGTPGPPMPIAGTAVLCIGDFNGDRRPDLLVSHAGGSSAVLLNDGWGGFLSPLTTNVGASVFMASADFDGDGRGDLAVGYPRGVSGCCVADGDSVAILHGEGNGTFAFLSSQQVNGLGGGAYSWTHLSSLTATELNGDGIPDLVAFAGGITEHSKACVLLNRGDGTFAPESAYTLPRELATLLVGDFNRDGRPDMASASNVVSGGRFTSVMNQGDGTFQVLPIVGIEQCPLAMTLGDFDGNGMPDIAVLYSRQTFPFSGSGPRGVCVLVNLLPPGGDTTPVPMEFSLSPSVLNLRSQGRWVTGRLQPPASYAASDIEVGAIRVNGTVPVDSLGPVTLGDHDGDGVGDLEVKFDRAALELTLSAGDSTGVAVRGLVAGRRFSANTTIRVQGTPRSTASKREDPAQPVAVLLTSLQAKSPNPVRGAPVVHLTLADYAPATLALYDVSGRLVSSREIGSLGAGTHQVTLGRSGDLSPGIYLIRLTQSGAVWVRRVVVLE